MRNLEQGRARNVLLFRPAGRRHPRTIDDQALTDALMQGTYTFGFVVTSTSCTLAAWAFLWPVAWLCGAPSVRREALHAREHPTSRNGAWTRAKQLGDDGRAICLGYASLVEAGASAVLFRAANQGKF